MALPLESYSTDQAPIDAFSGLPLPILHTDSHPAELLLADDLRSLHHDTHHGFYNRQSVESVPNGKIIRCLSLQETEREAHKRHHQGNPVGPPPPRTAEALAGMAVLATAGYVPGVGVGFTSHGIEEWMPIPSDRRRAAVSALGEGVIRVDDPAALKRFLANYVVRNGMSPGLRGELFRLLKDPDAYDKAAQVRGIIVKAGAVALRSVGDRFQEAWDRSELPLSSTSREVGEFIGSLLTTRGNGEPNRKFHTQLQLILDAI